MHPQTCLGRTVDIEVDSRAAWDALSPREQREHVEKAVAFSMGESFTKSSPAAIAKGTSAQAALWNRDGLATTSNNPELMRIGAELEKRAAAFGLAQNLQPQEAWMASVGAFEEAP